MTDTPLVAMTAGGPHAWIMINALRDRFGDFPIILEQGESQKEFWARRKRLLGGVKVASMKAARIPIRLKKGGSRAVLQEMTETERLNPNPPFGITPIEVETVNDDTTRSLLRSLAPKVVFVVSTRMIGTKTLSSVGAPFINYHSGINPAYRGMYGGYFALSKGDRVNFGATVHLVDRGVDTGDILYQSRVEPARQDNFHTYVWRLAAGSREIVIQAIEDALNDELQPYRVDLPSKQYFSPTFGGYLWTGVTRGVW